MAGKAELMIQKDTLTRAQLKTPKAAAVAGILFSVLLSIVVWLLRISVTSDPFEPGEWLGTSTRTVAVALNLVPFAGIAFLWFIGVLRARLGPREDKFFATVFLGSGLLFLAMLFAAAAAIGAVILAYAADPSGLVNSTTFHFARAYVYDLLNIYLVKTAAVFMISTCTVAIYTGFASRWIAFLGYVLSALLLFGSYYIAWSFVVFPFWIFVISVYILIDNVRHPSDVRAESEP